MFRDYVNLPRPIHILCLGQFINRAGSFVLVFLTIYISEQLGYGKTFAAQCMGVFGLGSIFASLVGGQLADQIGRRFVMLAALLGGAVFLLVLSVAESKVAVLLSILCYALVAEAFRPACSAMLGDFALPEQRPSAFGLYYISINLGFACGPPIGGVLADISYNLLFWGDALTMVVFALIIAACLPESRPTQQEDASTIEDVPLWLAVRRILQDAPFLMFCASNFLIAIVFMQGFGTLPMHIKDVGYSNFECGLLMAINGILIFACQLPLTHYLERFNAMANIVVGGIFITVGFGMYYLPLQWNVAAGVHLVVLILAVVTWTTGEMMQAPFKHTVVTNLAPTELRARYMGLLGMSYSLALTIGAPLGGFVLEHHGAASLWVACFLVSSLGVVAYRFCYQPVTRRSEVATA